FYRRAGDLPGKNASLRDSLCLPGGGLRGQGRAALGHQTGSGGRRDREYVRRKVGRKRRYSMDIKRAKQEIKDSIEAYLKKDAYGEYMIPAVRQRPILLMGPAGIGKTQIMEQIARECGIGLVSYTITHHTRQSAIGLPFIREKVYGGRTYSVTEYTMSEIIA